MKNKKIIKKVNNKKHKNREQTTNSSDFEGFWTGITISYLISYVIFV